MSPLADALISAGPIAEHAEAMALYGWLVGRWDLDITVYDQDIRRLTGWMAADWVLDGRAVQDVWHAEGFFHGTTLRVYDPAIDAWHIQWTAPQLGIRLTQLGTADPEGIVQDGTLPDGSAIRWSFRDIGPDAFRWRDERSRDGSTWQVYQEYRAARVS
ncbi:hypothetical protein [Mycobacterium talmoniae]|uniref:Uncharacterized protein n=1 Tax=Mycobacterium talmoniae TaxID=1858794 RepID=A0A1S1NGU4_9MYCO|nr:MULTISPECIES: hypothetical protein [Mycobacterium]OHV04966.1 hypothetical protein BKN37_07530 [Mycobacterium talmoniae]PQM48342.1 hypothetical protein C1Y40_01456 [Mycobacterium talmoniae]TDH53103.1 hypothetical protein E2F47_13150 [Mycobacterium eburneum]